MFGFGRGCRRWHQGADRRRIRGAQRRGSAWHGRDRRARSRLSNRHGCRPVDAFGVVARVAVALGLDQLDELQLVSEPEHVSSFHGEGVAGRNVPAEVGAGGRRSRPQLGGAFLPNSRRSLCVRADPGLRRPMDLPLAELGTQDHVPTNRTGTTATREIRKLWCL